MRSQGTIARWDDERGFGFIARPGDEEDVFVHIKAFSGTSRRPVVGDTVFYQPGKDSQGRLRAEKARFADQPESEPPTRSTGMRSRGRGPVLFAGLFAGFLIAAACLGRLSWLVVGAYGVMSLVTFVTYGLDKSSAKQGRRRIMEANLHTMGLLGGWPGGLAAQRLFRHKSSKSKFLVEFWITVALNVVGVGYLVWMGETGLLHQWLDALWQSVV